MSSGVSGAAQHLFLSTHNALRVEADNDDKIWIYASELRGTRQAAFPVFPFYDIEMVKRLVIKHLELPPSTNVSEIRIFHRGTELPNHRSLIAFATERERCNIRFHWAFREVAVAVGLRELGIRPPPGLQATMSEINLAIQRGVNPKLTMDGTGGTYILTNTKRQSVAMFKPCDEEAFAPNNPRGYKGKMGQKGFRAGVLSGEGSQREVAAFLLDAQYGGVAGVPETTKIEACHQSFSHNTKAVNMDLPCSISDQLFWKEGSLQEFVDAHETCGDYDATVFSISDAHKIGILDLRVLNLDRNDGNILVGPLQQSPISIPGGGHLTPDGRPSKFRLIPIDHGLILPDTMDVGDIDLVWFYWPQSKMPFSEAELRHIFSIDADKDALRLARKLEIREECLRTMRVSTRILQIGARMHLNLFQITSFVVRFGDFDVPSIMERAVHTALTQAWTAVNSTSLMHHNRLAGSVTIDLHLAAQGPRSPPDENRRVRLADKSDSETKTERLLHPVNSPNEKRNSAIFEAPFLSLTNYEIRRDSSPSWDSFSSDSEASDSSDGDVAVSRITGIPLCGSSAMRRRKQTEEAPLAKSDSLKSALTVPFAKATLSSANTSDGEIRVRRKHTSFSPDSDALPTRTNTVRKRPTALARRGTSSRATYNVNSSWTLADSNKKVIPLDWDNPLLEKTFFECFERVIRHHIIETHPDWEAYQFNGNAVLREFESRHRRKSTCHRWRPGASSSGADFVSFSHTSSGCEKKPDDAPP